MCFSKRWLTVAFLVLASTVGLAQTTVFYTDRAVGTFPFPGGGGQTSLVPIQFGQVRVCNFPPTGSPCTNPASITDVNSVPLSIVGGNFGQITTDVVGRFSFGCSPGLYQVQVAGSFSNVPQLSYPITCPSGTSSILGANNTWTGINTFTGQVVLNNSANTFNNLIGSGVNSSVQLSGAGVLFSALNAGVGYTVSPAGFNSVPVGGGSVNLAFANTAGNFVQVLQAANDTVVSRGTTDTLTNKTLTGTSSGNSVTVPASCTFQNNLAPVTGNSADQTFFTCTLAGGTVATNKGLRVTFTWKHSTGTAAITYKLSVGGTVIINFGSIADAISSTYSMQVILFNEGGTLAKAGQYFYDDSGVGRGTGGYSRAIAINLASNQAIALTFNVANTDQVTPDLMVAEVIQ